MEEAVGGKQVGMKMGKGLPPVSFGTQTSLYFFAASGHIPSLVADY